MGRCDKDDKPDKRQATSSRRQVAETLQFANCKQKHSIQTKLTKAWHGFGILSLTVVKYKKDCFPRQLFAQVFLALLN